MKKKVFLVLFLLLLSGVLIHSYAQDYLEGHALQNRVLTVATSRYKESQDRMTASYTLLNRSLDRIGQHKLHIAQRDWERFKKSSCAFETDYARNQDLEKVLIEGCFISMNNARITYMDNQLKSNYTIDPGMAVAPSQSH